MKAYWLIRSSMPGVLALESKCFERPLIEEEILALLRQRNIIGKVADIDDRAATYMLYELRPDHLRVLRIAVDPRHQRRKVGAAMLWHLKDKLAQQRRKFITAFVPDDNLVAQSFFASQGFKAVCVNGPWYEMRFNLTSQDDTFSPWHPRNRVAAYMTE